MSFASNARTLTPKEIEAAALLLGWSDRREEEEEEVEEEDFSVREPSPADDAIKRMSELFKEGHLLMAQCWETAAEDATDEIQKKTFLSYAKMLRNFANLSST